MYFECPAVNIARMRAHQEFTLLNGTKTMLYLL